GFEAGLTDGWRSSAGGAGLTVSTAFANSGTHSLRATGRAQPLDGPSWAMPIGPGTYNVVFHVLQASPASAAHTLNLLPTYSCVNLSDQLAPPVSVVLANSNEWVMMSGTFT